MALFALLLIGTTHFVWSLVVAALHPHMWRPYVSVRWTNEYADTTVFIVICIHWLSSTLPLRGALRTKYHRINLILFRRKVKRCNWSHRYTWAWWEREPFTTETKLRRKKYIHLHSPAVNQGSHHYRFYENRTTCLSVTPLDMDGRIVRQIDGRTKTELWNFKQDLAALG